MNKSIIVLIAVIVLSFSVFAVDVPILSYHVVTDSVQDGVWTISKQNFENHLAYLKNNGFSSWSFEQFDECYRSNCTTDMKPVILTFDDGTKDHVTRVMPLLEKYGFKGEFAIVTGFLGTQGYMSLQDVKILALNGHGISSHTVSHRSSNSLTESGLREEFLDSKNYLMSNGLSAQYLVYPYYASNVNVRKICLEYYSLCFGDTSGTPLNTVDALNRGAIRRIALSNANNLSINAFAYYVDRHNTKKNYGTVTYVNSSTYTNITGLNTSKNILQAEWTGWNFYTNGKGSFKDGIIIVQEKGSNQQLFQKNIALEPNTEYYVTIKISTSLGSPIRIDLLKHTSPYTLYAQGWNVSPGIPGSEFKTIIRTNNRASGDARVMLWLGNIKKGEQVKITKIEMVKKI